MSSKDSRRPSSRHSFSSDIDDILAAAATVTASVMAGGDGSTMQQSPTIAAAADLSTMLATFPLPPQSTATAGFTSSTSFSIDMPLQSTTSLASAASESTEFKPMTSLDPRADEIEQASPATIVKDDKQSNVVEPSSATIARRDTVTQVRPRSASTSSAETSTSQATCPCHLVVPRSDTVNCGLCHTTIQALFEGRRERLQLLDQLDQYQRELANEEGRTERVMKENQRLMLRIKELEDALDERADTIDTLRKDLHALSTKLVREVEKRAELQAERDKISEELEELTRSLFEEANTMVSDEAKRRHELEQARKRLQEELGKTKDKLQGEKMNVVKLRRKLSEMTMISLRSSISGHAPSSEVIVQLQSEVSQDNRLVIQNDSFASLDVDLLNDRRHFENFKQFYQKLDSAPFHKLGTTISFLRSCIEEHVEPCIKFPKLSTRKVTESILNGNLGLLKIQTASNAVSPVSTSSQPPLTDNLSHAAPSSGRSSLATSPAHSPTKEMSTLGSSLVSLKQTNEQARASSPAPKTQTWFGSSSSIVDSNACAACGREGPCLYQIVITPSTSTSTASSFSSSLTARLELGPSSLNGLKIDLACRDRMHAALEFYSFLRRLKRVRDQMVSNESETDGTNGPASFLEPLYIDFLRSLKQLFYARIGVLSYFRRIEVCVQEIEVNEEGVKNQGFVSQSMTDPEDTGEASPSSRSSSLPSSLSPLTSLPP